MPKPPRIWQLPEHSEDLSYLKRFLPDPDANEKPYPLSNYLPERDWCVEPFLAAGELTLVVGTKSVGKSMFLRAIEARLPSDSVIWSDDVSRSNGRHIFADADFLPKYATEYLKGLWLKGRDTWLGRDYWNKAIERARENGYGIAVEVRVDPSLKCVAKTNRSDALRYFLFRDAKQRDRTLIQVLYGPKSPILEFREGAFGFADPQPHRGLFCGEGSRLSFPTEAYRLRAWRCALALAKFLDNSTRTPQEALAWGQANGFSRNALYEAAGILGTTRQGHDDATGHFRSSKWNLRYFRGFHHFLTVYPLSDRSIEARDTP